jgi:hypothetical protein
VKGGKRRFRGFGAPEADVVVVAEFDGTAQEGVTRHQFRPDIEDSVRRHEVGTGFEPKMKVPTSRMRQHSIMSDSKSLREEEGERGRRTCRLLHLQSLRHGFPGSRTPQ